MAITAVKKSDNSATCVPAFASVSKSLNFKCAYVNPTTGTQARDWMPSSNTDEKHWPFWQRMSASRITEPRVMVAARSMRYPSAAAAILGGGTPDRLVPVDQPIEDTTEPTP